MPARGRSRSDIRLARFPDLVKQWHPTRNGSLLPAEVRAGSHTKVWWRCPKGPDHEWCAQAKSRGGPLARGCPFCSGRRASVTNSLARAAPKLLAEWDAERNGALTPAHVVAGSARKCWWRCRAGHSWNAQARLRAAGRRCPFCAGQRVSTTNNIAAGYPEVAAEWDTAKNASVSPSENRCRLKKEVLVALRTGTLLGGERGKPNASRSGMSPLRSGATAWSAQESSCSKRSSGTSVRAGRNPEPRRARDRSRGVARGVRHRRREEAEQSGRGCAHEAIARTSPTLSSATAPRARSAQSAVDASRDRGPRSPPAFP